MEIFIPATAIVPSSDAYKLEGIISAAVDAERHAGRIDPDTRASISAPRRTRDRQHWRVVLDLGVNREPREGEGRRRVTAYGHPVPGGFTASGTFDEYGWILARLFDAYPAMIVGRPASPVYRDREEFDHKTGLTYNPDALLAALWPTFPDSDPYPYLSARSKAGRRGYGRVIADGTSFRYGIYAPRSAADVRAFAKLDAGAVSA